MVDSSVAIVFAKKKLVSGDVSSKIMCAVLICNKNSIKFDEKFFSLFEGQKSIFSKICKIA